MAKVYTYIIIFVGIDLLFLLAGINTIGSKLLEAIGIESNNITAAGGFMIGVLALSLASFITAISTKGSSSTTIGTIGTSLVTAGALAAVSTPLMFVAWDILQIIKIGGNTVFGIIAALILLPLTAGYIIAIMSFLNGND